MVFRLIKMVGAFFLAVVLLAIMTPWAVLTSLMALVFDGLNKLYAKLVEYLIKNGEGL